MLRMHIGLIPLMERDVTLLRIKQGGSRDYEDTRGGTRNASRVSENPQRSRRGGAHGPPGVERFQSLEIFMRDGWRCQICGGKIRQYKKTPHPHSPTIDHIIPLAAGGTHERKNVQAAHFICNSEKGTRGNDQLLLIG